MNTFVIIFRRRLPALSDTDRQQLTKETADWAKTCNEAGHNLDPRILSAEATVAGRESSAVQNNDWVVSALLFIEAQNLKEAAQIAEAHPGLRYGFNVEVRPWTKPTPPTTAR